uniref:Uncharacterized protein n=1 Tax=Candidatus Kentrum sp. DK TaxID=2126562 RepID=A0A450TN60_9GAMM|nr:MAG: hypothetical protein BECKDK2373C_GA0170839_12092 [Candidatus Kentron sp. DK]
MAFFCNIPSNEKKLFWIFGLFLFVLFDRASFAETCPVHSVSCRPNPTSRHVLEEGVSTSGMVSGRVVDTGDKIYIVGSRIQQNNSSVPAISIRTVKRKKIVLSGVQVSSSGARIDDGEGMAAIVAIQSEHADAEVVLDGLRLKSRGARIDAKSNGTLSCASLICIQLTGKDHLSVDNRNSTVRAQGRTILRSELK